MHAAEHLQLQINPFAASASGARLGRPLQAALGEVIRQIGLEAPVVVVCGNAGAGKTLLIKMIARSCTDMGLCARQIDRGDLMHVAFGQCADVLLIDEADSITESTLQSLTSAGSNTSTTTMIFLCLPSNVRRFTSSGGRAVIIELAPLLHSDARNYLLERATSAGRPDLFDADALDLQPGSQRLGNRHQGLVGLEPVVQQPGDGADQLQSPMRRQRALPRGPDTAATLRMRQSPSIRRSTTCSIQSRSMEVDPEGVRRLVTTHAAAKSPSCRKSVRSTRTSKFRRSGLCIASST